MTGAVVWQHYVTSGDGTKISVSITGTGPPLVVSPGSLATAEDWQSVAGALAPRMTSYAVDRRALVLPDAEPAEIPGQAHDAHVFDAAAIGEKIAEFALQSARHRGKSN
jgi:pimeloyl-ACP methyl ester carboxylesterase